MIDPNSLLRKTDREFITEEIPIIYHKEGQEKIFRVGPTETRTRIARFRV